MELVEVIVSIGLGVISLVSCIVTFIVKLVRRGKEIKLLKDKKRVEDEVLELMIDAESIPTSGSVKKEYVISKLKAISAKMDIVVDVNEVSSRIEELIKLSKLVNRRKEIA